MTALRRKVTVAFGGGEPIHLVTNARDVANAAEHGSNSAMAIYALAYSALQRYGHDVPPTFDEFVDALDDIQGGQGGEDPLSPTRNGASTAEPSPYPSQQEPATQTG